MTPNELLLYILLIVGLSFVLTMIALIDLLKKDFPTTKKKNLFGTLWPLFRSSAGFSILPWALKKGTRKKFDS
jgi:hypothetical protein